MTCLFQIVIMTKKNQGKKKTCLKKSTGGDYRRQQQALVCPSRTRSDHMLTKVALLLVLLPHMAQTKYARGKKKAAEFFVSFTSCRYLFFHRDEMYVSKLLHKERHLHFEPYFGGLAGVINSCTTAL